MESKLEQNSIEYLTHEQRRILMTPVFIVGAGRSGTTWLQRILLENDKIVGGQEAHFFRLFDDLLNSVKNKSCDSRAVGLSTYWNVEEFYLQVRNIWLKTFAPLMECETELLLEKTPNNVLFMENIKEIIPNAKFIHLIRDSRSVVASMLAAHSGWGSHWAQDNAKDAAVTWWRYVSAGRLAGKGLLSSEYIEVHYDDLLMNPVEGMSKIYKFLELDYTIDNIKRDISTQEFLKQQQKNGSGIRTVSGEELKEPEGFIRKGQSDSWKKDLSLFQQLVVWRYTRKLMKECGYNWNGRIKEDEAKGG